MIDYIRMKLIKKLQCLNLTCSCLPKNKIKDKKTLDFHKSTFESRACTILKYFLNKILTEINIEV